MTDDPGYIDQLSAKVSEARNHLSVMSWLFTGVIAIPAVPISTMTLYLTSEEGLGFGLCVVLLLVFMGSIALTGSVLGDLIRVAGRYNLLNHELETMNSKDSTRVESPANQ